MAETFFPFNSSNGDRKYKAEHWAHYFALFLGNGVFWKDAYQLKVIAGEGMSIVLKAGNMFINGRCYTNDSDREIDIEDADGVANRIDRVVIRCDYAGRIIECDVKKGAVSQNPSALDIVRNADMYEMGLADIYIGKGVVSITDANITDLRLNDEFCGRVAGLIDEIDTTEIFVQFQTFLEEFKSKQVVEFEAWENETFESWEDEFRTWFDDLKGKLGEDPATTLQEQINYLNTTSNFTHHKSEIIIDQNSVEGFTNGTIIEGQTFKNLLDFNAELLDIVEGNYYNRISKQGSALNMSTSGYTEALFIQNIDLIKPNTVYTLIINIISNTSADKPKLLNKGSNLINPEEDKLLELGANKFVLTSTSDMTRPRIFSVNIAESNPAKNVQFNVVLLDGDWADKDVPLGINGLESVNGDLAVKTCGENLFDIHKAIVSTGSGVTYAYDEDILKVSASKSYQPVNFDILDIIELNKTYNFHAKSTQLLGIGIVDIYAVFSDGSKNYLNQGNFKLTKTIDTIRVRVIPNNTSNTNLNTITVEEIMIQNIIEDTEPIPFTPYTGDNLDLGQCELHRLSDDIFDYIDLASGELVKKVGKMIYDGAEPWVRVTIESPNSYTLSDSLLIKTNNALLTDRYDQILHADRYFDKTCFVYNNEGVNNGLVISDDEYTTEQEFKEYLEENPLTVLYELDTPIITKITSKELQTFKNQTNIRIVGSTIQPIINTKVPNNINTGQDFALKEISRRSDISATELMNLIDRNGEESKQAIKEVEDEIAKKAPKDHASAIGEYGSATENNYGHTRLSDSVESEDDATSGKAATPKAVKTVNDKAKGNEKDITNLKQSLVNRQSQLAAQLTNKGVAASGDETLAQLIPKVGNIQTDVLSDLFFHNVWQGSFPGKNDVGDVAGTIAMAFTIPAGQSIVTLSYAQTVDSGGYAGYNYSSRFRDLNYGGTLLRDNSYPASVYPEIINYGGGAGRVQVYRFSSNIQRTVTIYLDSLGAYVKQYIATVSVVK